jgi:3-dehydro-L-gulonate 2-dehydrogenase
MDTKNETVFIPADQMRSELIRILLKMGFSGSKAEICASVFTENSLEGVYSHGINRFYSFVKTCSEGFIKPDAEISRISSNGAFETWDGNLGPGIINAIAATDRAMELAVENGIGLVALRNTNHWMRGGTYGWMAARKGFVFIGWTNTCANLPAWGASDARLGNNPLIVAVPYYGSAVVLDSAMSQFSYGRMETYKLKGEKLPINGGFDSDGNLTDDPAEIIKTKRALPAGFWKGSSTALLLDILAAGLSGGRTTEEISLTETEYGVSQVFIAINPGCNGSHHFSGIVESVINDLRRSKPAIDGSVIRYPGENVKDIRSASQVRGIPVTRLVWDKISGLYRDQ